MPTDNYAHAQQAGTALHTQEAATEEVEDLHAVDTGNNSDSFSVDGSSSSQEGNGDDEVSALEIADDRHPVCAYLEIVTIRSLLLEHVGVVLTSSQINSPDVQLNLITPLWQDICQKCGVLRPEDLRCHPNTVDCEGQRLASASILYAALANRDYFMLLASAGLSQADIHESRAEVAESLAIMCAKALHKQSKSALANALCVKYTPIDFGTFVTEMSCIASHHHHHHRSKLFIRGQRHMSQLASDQRVRVYRLGKAGHVDLPELNSPSPYSLNGRSCCSFRNSASAIEATVLQTPYPQGSSTWPTTAATISGDATSVDELKHQYLSNGSRIMVERAVEVAIRCEAKRFIAHKLVVEIMRLLWDGTLHWKGHRCVCLAGSPVTTNVDNSQSGLYMEFSQQPTIPDSSTPLLPISRGSRLPYWKNPKIAALETLLKTTLDPLRIPMVENILTMVHSFLFLMLYTAVSLTRQDSVSVLEVVLHVCIFAYIADEIRQCTESGLSVYIKSVWNILDVSIYGIFIAFFSMRMHSLYTGSQRDIDQAYDLLALNATLLWPRLFAVLDQYEFFGTIIIQVRRIISGASLFFALLIVMTVGFFQTFYALGQRHNQLAAGRIWGLMARIFFGSALLGWDQAELFGPYVGVVVMGMYIGVSMLVLYNILIGVINRCMVEITKNSLLEFRFAYTMRVAEYVSARQTYPCVPPLNLLRIFVFWPLRHMVSHHRIFELIRSMFILMVYVPHLAVYYICRWWWRRQTRAGIMGSGKAMRAECRLAEKEIPISRHEAEADKDEGLDQLQQQQHRWSSLMESWRKKKQLSDRVASLEQSMADIDSKLEGITQLLRPVTSTTSTKKVNK